MGEDQAELLLRLAREDELAARSPVPIEAVADSILGFHCQQAVEKALKAALAAHEVDVPRTHDLEGLLRRCRRTGIEIPERLQGVERLAPYGVQMRYGAIRSTTLDREQALGWASAAVEWAGERTRTRDRQDLWRSRSQPDRADR